MGAEKGFTELLRLQIAGEQGTPAGLNWKGGTPNHWALAAATAYGYGLKGNPQQKKAGRQKALDFFHTQDQVGHMARAKVSEFGTPSHFAWWQAAVAGLWLLADRAGDKEVLAAARAWWVRRKGTWSSPGPGRTSGEWTRIRGGSGTWGARSS
jgi:hypothetical protein